MPFIEKHRRRRPGKPELVRWRARYRDASGREHSWSFVRKVDAEHWLARTATDVARGTWVDPALGRMPLAVWLQHWLRPSRADAEDARELPVAPALAHPAGPRSDRLSHLRRSDLNSWMPA